MWIANIYVYTLLFLDGICKSAECIKSGKKMAFKCSSVVINV